MLLIPGCMLIVVLNLSTAVAKDTFAKLTVASSQSCVVSMGLSPCCRSGINKAKAVDKDKEQHARSDLPW